MSHLIAQMSMFPQRATVTGSSQLLWGLLTSVGPGEEAEGTKRGMEIQIKDKHLGIGATSLDNCDVPRKCY